ncbi:UNVERIFIED_CONTAM: hypothetical protein HDU68_011779 [Siphonaria sp. JEL0065]|nr:hypothetical protein HDU68_011779 [Siphonaria sp. JEL0065]
MPPYVQPNDPYQQFSNLGKLVPGLDARSLQVESSPTPDSSVFSTLTRPDMTIPLGAGFVAVGIVASVFLFVRHQRLKRKRELKSDEHMLEIIKKLKQKTDQDIVLKTTRVAPLPPLVFQDKSGSRTFPQPQYEETPPLLTLMKHIRSGSSGNSPITPPPEMPDIYYKAKSQSHTATPLVEDDKDENKETNVEENLDDNVAVPKRAISLRRKSTASDTPPLVQMDEIEQDGIETPMIMVDKRGGSRRRKSQSSSINESVSEEAGASLTDLLQAALPDKLGESYYTFKSANTSTTSVSMLSAKIMRFKVEKPWIPQQPDELLLNVDDIVHVYQTYNDCWCEGFVEGAENQFGMFPRDCLGEHPLSLWDLAQNSRSGSTDDPVQHSASMDDPGMRETTVE